MSILDMPNDHFRSLEVRLSTPQQVTRSGYTGRRQVMSTPWHGRWSLVAEHVPIIGEENFRPWRAFLAKLEGQARAFRFPLSEGDQYTSAVSPVVNGDQALPRTSLETNGWPEDDDDFPSAGMFVTINGQALQLTDVITVAGGPARRIIHFRPPLRTAATDGTPIIANEPYAVVASDESETGYSVIPGPLYTITIAASETMSEPFAEYDLALDFVSSRYRVGSSLINDVTDLDGYTYTRSGTKAELHVTGTPLTYAANVPGIPAGVGYWSRQSLTNLMLRSQEFDNASWSAGGATVTADFTFSPAGTATADKLQEDSNLASHLVTQTVTIADATTYTASILAKTGGSRGLLLWFTDTGLANGVRVLADLTNGTISDGAAFGTGWTYVGSSIEAVGNDDWYRISLTFTSGDTSGAFTALLADGTTQPFYQGDGTSYVDIWQAQLVAGAKKGPLISTTSASATAGEDLLYHTVDAFADEDMLIWVDATPEDNGAFNQAWGGFNDGTTDNRLQLYASSTSAGAYIEIGAVAVLNHTATAIVAGTRTRLLMRRLSGQWRAAAVTDGTLTWLGAAVTAGVPAVDRFYPGNFLGGGSPLRGVVHGAYVLPGTFPTDADVIAAVERVN